MRKILFILLISLVNLVYGQDIKPIDPINFKNLQSPSFSFYTIDSSVWIYKGSVLQWTKLATARQLDTLSFLRTETDPIYSLDSANIVWFSDLDTLGFIRSEIDPIYAIDSSYLKSHVRNDEDLDSTNEIQDLSGSGANLSGYVISLSEDATTVILPNESDPVYNIDKPNITTFDDLDTLSFIRDIGSGTTDFFTIWKDGPNSILEDAPFTRFLESGGFYNPQKGILMSPDVSQNHNTAIQIQNLNASTTYYPAIVMYKTNAGDAVTTGHVLGKIGFVGDGATGASTDGLGAEIVVDATGTWNETTGERPTKLQIKLNQTGDTNSQPTAVFEANRDGVKVWGEGVYFIDLTTAGIDDTKKVMYNTTTGKITYKDDIDTNTTYGISSVAGTGGANLRLTGINPSSTDDVIFKGSGTTTVTSTDANTVTITSTEVDGSITNEGVLGVSAGSATSSVITSNTSGSTGVTVNSGTGLSISEVTSSNGGSITLNHTNSVTASNFGPTVNSSLTFGGTFTVPYATYDAQGHITGSANRTLTMPANPNTDSQNLSLGTTTTTTQPINISSGTGVTLPAATTSAAGLMSAADKEILGNISSTYVPYTGATATVNLGSQALTTTGNITGNRLISTVATGTAPLSVSSSTVVSNLNADLLDGQHGQNWADHRFMSNVITDFNTNYRAGVGYWLPSTSNFPAGLSTSTYGTTFSFVGNETPDHDNSSNWLTTLYIPTVGNNVYIRKKINASGWGGLVTLYNNANFLAGTHYQTPLTNTLSSGYIPYWDGLNLSNSIASTDGSKLVLNNTQTIKLELTGGSTQNGLFLNPVGLAKQYYIGAGINLLTASGNADDRGFMAGYNMTTGKAALLYDDNNDIEFGAGSSGFLMKITSGGNVGIGANPSQKLDVNGNARFRSIGTGTLSSLLGVTSDGTLTTNVSGLTGNWTTAYNDKINSAAFSGTTTKTLTLTQQDGGTVTASFTDDNTTYTAGTGIGASGTTLNLGLEELTTGAPSLNTHFLPWVNSANNLHYRVGLLDLQEISGWDAGKIQNITVSSTAPTTNYVLKYNGSQWAPAPDATGASYWTQSSGALYPATIGNEVRIGSATDLGAHKLQVDASSVFRLRNVNTSQPIDFITAGTGTQPYFRFEHDGNGGLRLASYDGSVGWNEAMRIMVTSSTPIFQSGIILSNITVPATAGAIKYDSGFGAIHDGTSWGSIAVTNKNNNFSIGQSITSSGAETMISILNTNAGATGISVRAGGTSTDILRLRNSSGTDRFRVTGGGEVRVSELTAHPTLPASTYAYYSISGVPYFKRGADPAVNLASGGGGGVTTYQGLTDAQDYSAGTANYYLRVNSTGTGIVLSNASVSAHSILAHSDVSYGTIANNDLIRYSTTLGGWVVNSPDMANLVDKTSDQTIGGIKTFSKKPIFPSSNSSWASINLSPGTNPTSPSAGDIWTTTTGVYSWINGSLRRLDEISEVPYVGATNSSYTLNLATHVNARSTTNTNITITISNPSEGKTGNIEVYHTPTAPATVTVTFSVPTNYNLFIADNIHNTTTYTYRKSVKSRTTGTFAVYSYYVSDNRIYINGTQFYD